MCNSTTIPSSTTRCCGSRPEWGPNHYGFDHSYGALCGAVDPWTHKYRHGAFEDTWHRDLKRVDEEGNATELVAKEVLPWIKQAHAPWFIYVPSSRTQ